MHLIVRHNSASSGGDVISLLSDRSFSFKYLASNPLCADVDQERLQDTNGERGGELVTLTRAQESELARGVCALPISMQTRPIIPAR